MIANFADEKELGSSLQQVGYFADSGLATAAFLALALQRPLFLEGEPGVGKTSFATAIATVVGAELQRLQCYEGIDASQALYEWNFPRQILQLRRLDGDAESQFPADLLYRDEFLTERPVLRALRRSPSVLLVDEIDRADEEFEAVLLEFLDTYQISIPELGAPIRAAVPPLVVLTSNRTREVHDALKRRCLYYWIPYPDHAREVRIVMQAVPDLPFGLAEELVAAVAVLRAAQLAKPPATSETIDCAQALRALRKDALDEATVVAVLPTLLKESSDVLRVLAGQDRIIADVLAATSQARRLP